MAFDDFDIGAGGSGVDISDHAAKRWRERVPSADRLTSRKWLNADPVVAPEADCDESRIYKISGGRDMLLCGQHKHGKVVVSTVLYADWDRIR